MDEDALLAGILDKPDDDVARLVYADWLQEHEQDDRAEFIRESIRRTGLISTQRRLDLHRIEAQRWASRFGLDAEAFEFDRGFPYRITFLPAQFVEHAEELFRFAPVREWKAGGNAICEPPPPIRWDEDTFRDLARCRELERLTLLDLEDGHATEEVLGPLLESQYLHYLQILVLGWNRLGVGDGAGALADASLPNLRRLDLCGNGLDEEELAVILENPFWLNLRIAILAYNPIRDAGLSVLAGLEAPALTDLDLSRIHATPSGWNEYGDAPFMRGLRRLNLTANDLGFGLRSITHGGLRNLEALELVNCGIMPESADLLAEPTFADSLEALSLDNEWDGGDGEAENQIGDEGLQLLAAGRFTKLNDLGIMSNGITEVGVRHLLASPLMRTLADLNLNANPIGDEGAILIARSPTSARLLNLGLHDCGISDEGARALLDSPHLTNLDGLTIGRNQISEAIMARLKERFDGD